MPFLGDMLISRRVYKPIHGNASNHHVGPNVFQKVHFFPFRIVAVFLGDNERIKVLVKLARDRKREKITP